MCDDMKPCFIKTIPELYASIKEADERIIGHALNSARNSSCLVILLNDTAILILALYFWRQLANLGCNIIYWMNIH